MCAIHSIQRSYVKMHNCLLLILMRQKIGRQWCVPVKRGVGSGRRRRLRWVRSPKGDLCFNDNPRQHLPGPPAPCDFVFLWPVCCEALECVSSLWDQPKNESWLGGRMEAAAALTRLKGSLFRADEEWLMTRSTPLPLPSCFCPPAFPSPIKRFPHPYLCLLTECDLWHLFGCE